MKSKGRVKVASLTELVLEVFRLNGRLLAAGDILTRDIGLSSARWQVLGALGMASRPLTVAQVARSMGVTRQGVQRIADLLARQGVVQFVDNPDHQRSKLLQLSSRGRTVLRHIMQRQKLWATRTARAVDINALNSALSVLRKLRERLEQDDDDASGLSLAKEKSHAKIR
jgi:DNA-binding MarR family transcriptional regulator